MQAGIVAGTTRVAGAAVARITRRAGIDQLATSAGHGRKRDGVCRTPESSGVRDARALVGCRRAAYAMCSIPGGMDTHGCIRSSYTETVGSGNCGSAKAPTGMPTVPSLPSDV